MTYLNFLILFVVLPTLALVLLARLNRRHWTIIGILVVVAYIWTTPWDNYLVATGVWWYNPDLVLGITLGWVPLEEYLFFGVMTVMVGAWTVLVIRHLEPRPRLAKGLAVGALLAAAAALALMRAEPQPTGAAPWTYLILIVAWALPVALFQILVSGRILFSRWPAWVTSILGPGLYLTAMDTIALGAGTWEISQAQSLSLFLPGRVPVEEGVFFVLVTSLVAQGMLLATDPIMQERAKRLYAAVQRRLHARRQSASS